MSLRSELLWRAIDLDGTLAEPLWTPENPTSEIGLPIAKNVQKLVRAVSAGYKVVIHTARPSTDFEAIETWLNYYEIPFKMILTGKVLAASYVDDRAIHDSAPDWTSGAHCATCECNERK